MLKIRLKRLGAKKAPSYRIIVINSTTKREGKPVQELGFYNPKTKEMKLNKEVALDWITKGAQPTDTVAQHFVKLGIIKSLKRGSHKPNTDKKTKEQK